jgi:protein ImuB
MIRVGRQLWLCLHFPLLALEIFADAEQDPARPVAIVERQRVIAANPAAIARGVEHDMALNTAQALCSGLLALERQPQREQEALQQLAHWIYGLSPELGLADTGSLLLEVGACRRLYGGIAPLLDIIRRGLDERGHSVVAALAHTRKAAWLLARRQQPLALCGDRLDDDLLCRQLGALPVEWLGTECAGALAKMGIRTLHELAALPQAALGKRFGIDFIRYLQQLLGTHPDPQPPFVPLRKFQAALQFIDGIHNRQALLFPMKRLLQALCDYLQARQLTCTALRWELHDAHVPQAAMSVELTRADATRQRLRDLLELSELKLQNLPLREAVYTLVLRCEDFLATQPASPQLFAADTPAPEAAANEFAGLVDKLRARLGAAALERLACRPAHWPEQASLAQRIDAATAIDAVAATPVAPRPLWLLPAPQPLRERAQQLYWQSPLKILRGPERIDNAWWEETPATRDYYIARTEEGQLCWIFRDIGSGHWFAHGLFA